MVTRCCKSACFSKFSFLFLSPSLFFFFSHDFELSFSGKVLGKKVLEEDLAGFDDDRRGFGGKVVSSEEA